MTRIGALISVAAGLALAAGSAHAEPQDPVKAMGRANVTKLAELTGLSPVTALNAVQKGERRDVKQLLSYYGRRGTKNLEKAIQDEIKAYEKRCKEIPGSFDECMEPAEGHKQELKAVARMKKEAKDDVKVRVRLAAWAYFVEAQQSFFLPRLKKAGAPCLSQQDRRCRKKIERLKRGQHALLALVSERK